MVLPRSGNPPATQHQPSAGRIIGRDAKARLPYIQGSETADPKRQTASLSDPPILDKAHKTVQCNAAKCGQVVAAFEAIAAEAEWERLTASRPTRAPLHSRELC